VVARVNGVALTDTRLNAALNAMIPLESFHRVVSPAKMEEFRRQALDRIVEDELQHLEGVRLGVAVPDSQVGEEVDALQRQYKNREGLEAALAKSGSTIAELRLELRRSLIINETRRRAVTTKCQVAPAEAEAFFGANPDRFVVPEQLHIYAITIGVEPSASAAQWADARQRAEDVRKRILAGAAFEEMARTHSTDSSSTSGGDMGLLHRGAMTEEFEEATRGLAIGQPGEVVQSLYGFHIVEITEIRPPQHKTFAAIAPDLQRDLTATRCESMKAAWIAELRGRAAVVLGEAP
jgi:peptidyl-prolyl cis-trans isomerase C